MTQVFDTVGTSGKARFPAFAPADVTMKGLAAVAKVAQAMGIEWVDYARRSGEHRTEALRQLRLARTPQAIAAVQADYLAEAGVRMLDQSKAVASLSADLADALSRHWGKPFATKAA